MFNKKIKLVLALIAAVPYFSIAQQTPDMYKSQADQAVKSMSGFDLESNQNIKNLNKKLKTVKTQSSPQTKEIESVLKNSVLKAQKEYGISK